MTSKQKGNANAGPDTISSQAVLGKGGNEPMKLTKLTLTLLTSTTVVPLLIAGMLLRGAAQTTPSDCNSLIGSDDSTQVKIARAMSAGPTEVAKAARIVDTDAQGKMVILREGNNGFTCMPGNLKVVGEPPMCVDAPSMQWFADAKAHKPKPTNTVPGITYMLAGATQRSDSDPNDTTSMSIDVGPHWMIMWPFDPKTTDYQPRTSRPARTSCGPGRRTRMCHHGTSIKRFHRVGAFNGHELWLKQDRQGLYSGIFDSRCDREEVVFSTWWRRAYERSQ
jgi:hypothetical protein